ncbi:MAG: iron-containing alcohol dehydrogenase, partial [Bacteroidales bacterium]|nr:iron-containing alcohol dehydrogenase [Bacteroidales bacterium]
MNNFEYYNPVKILFGNDKIEQLKKEIGDSKKILLTYGGGSIKKNGTYERVINALSGCNIVEFGGIEANPKYETLLKAIELGRKNNIDFILAV